MRRLTSLEDFEQLRGIMMKESSEENPCLVISAGTCGQASGANDLIRITKRYILEKNLQDLIKLRITGCHGFCEVEPFILVKPGNILYPNINIKNVPKVIDAVLKGQVIEELCYSEGWDSKKVKRMDDISFFKKQIRTVLHKNEEVDPIRIYDYIKIGGYTALVKTLRKNDPEWIIGEIKKSELRGRGGSGFLTGLKWKFARASGKPGTKKFMVCNADEGDPGAYMDRSLLEGNPHSIIEGLIIAGLAIGATTGIIYVRCEYPLAIKHSIIAIRQARELGLLGENILGTGLSFDIQIVKGAGAFVCGEETALIKSIEGRIGEPRQRPPYPTDKGINGSPTCINNVETLANIPIIMSIGAEEFAKVGVPGNTGTKIFSLVGKIKNTGLVEVPMGTTLKEIIYSIGGGPVSDAKIKAVQTGGPSGGCIPASMFDLPIDYESLVKAGSIMGSGGMIVMDENTCMVDIAKYFMKFLMEESCGKCYTCRKGTQRMYEILDDVTKGIGTLEQLDLLEELAYVVKDTTMCGLGQTASNPVLSTLRYFRDEYIEHIRHKKCPAGVCKELVGAPCQDACPLGTEAWKYVAYIQRGEFEKAYNAIRKPNPFPSVCARVCNHPCEERCRSGKSGGQPIAIRALKRFITDRFEPPVYTVKHTAGNGRKMPEIAVIGAGPSGLTAAHYLSLAGYKVTIFEAESEPGGMLVCGIPSFRLPREVLKKEIDSLLNKNIELKCNLCFGKDITLDDLFKKGYKAVYIALGAHKCKRLNIPNEDAPGVYPSIQFLKEFNLRSNNLARGKVGILGGGNSAIDSARVARRQNGVESVTVLYRRTEQEMPAYREEIEAAVEEGISIETLVSPVEVLVKNGRLARLKCIKNKLGDVDASGRRTPVPIKGSEYIIKLDTLIVAIGEEPETESISQDKIEIDKGKNIKINNETLETNIKGVFAGGDVVTGPNTVVDAIAVGKKAAQIISRYLSGKPLEIPPEIHLPEVYIEPDADNLQKYERTERAAQPVIELAQRCVSFTEVDKSLILEDAVGETGRCLRCDLEFAQKENARNGLSVSELKEEHYGHA